MEDYETESIDFDTTFDIECIIYNALYNTISQAISEEIEKDGSAPIIDKEVMLKNILSRNIDGLEEQQYMTEGPEGKVYLCGSWLMRSVLSTNGELKPMGEHIKSLADCTNIVFLPNKTGSELRKELWPAQCEGYSSYDLPKDCRIAPSEAMQPHAGPPMGMGRPVGAEPLVPPAHIMPIEPVDVDEDVFTKIKKEIYTVLTMTVSCAIDEDVEGKGTPASTEKDVMLRTIVSRNLDAMEKTQYLFQQGDTVFVCGEWLLREVTAGEKKYPMIAHLKTKFHQYENIVYRPDITGTALQAEMKK